MCRGVHDVITGNKFHHNRLRGFRATGVQISGTPIDLACRPYNSLALPCWLWFTYLFLSNTQSTQSWPAFGRPCWRIWFGNRRERVDRWQYVLQIVNRNDLCGTGQNLISTVSLWDASWQRPPVNVDPRVWRGSVITQWWCNDGQLLNCCLQKHYERALIYSLADHEVVDLMAESSRREFSGHWRSRSLS